MRASAPGLLSRRLWREPVPDERLVARVRAGDARAFEEIYDRYGQVVHSFCRHLLGQADDADDAVQHTFLAAYRAINGGDQAIDLKPWLFAIARNRCISLLRTRRRDPSLVGEPPEPVTEGLSAAVERRESIRDLLGDIGSLPDDQRAALILTQLGTLKHDEVARVLEVPPEKVKALVFQARSSLLSTRVAREADCYDIREQLATLSGAALLRGTLRRHLLACDGCRDFQLELKRQRAALVVLLPVVAGPALRSKMLGEIGGGAGGAAGAGVGVGGWSGAGGVLGALAAKGAALKVGLAITLAATGAGAVSLTGGVRLALGDSPPKASKLAARGVTTQAGGRRATISLPKRPGSVGDSGFRGSAGAGQVPAMTQRGALRAGGPALGNEHSSSPGHRLEPAGGSAASTGQGGTPPGLAKHGGAPPGAGKEGHPPPGLAKKGGTPPGLAKKGGTPPGLAKKGGTPPGLAKNGGSPSGKAKNNGTAPGHPNPGGAPSAQPQRNPPATGGSGTTPAPAAQGNGNAGGNGNVAGPGSGNGNSGGNGSGTANAGGGNANGGGNGHGSGNGAGNGHGGG